MTTSTGKARGRPPGLPKVPGSGRVKKSLDKGQRQLVSAELAHSILVTFAKTGGVAGMVKWVMDNNANRTAFYTQILSRLMPAPQKSDDGDFAVQNNQYNVSTMSPVEVARNVAFALNLGLHLAEQEQQVVADVTPQPVTLHRPDAPPEAYPKWRPPIDAPDMKEPTDLSSPYDATAKAPGFSYDEQDSRPYNEQYAAWALCKDTVECDLSSYAGDPAEQGHTPVQRPSLSRKPSISEIRRKQLL